MALKVMAATVAMALFVAGCGGNSDPAPENANAERAPSRNRLFLANTATAFPKNRKDYTLTKSATGFVVKDNSSGESAEAGVHVQTIKFADVTVNREIGDKSHAIATNDLKTLIELYVAFFNRIPDAEGLSYWIDQFMAGQSIDSIAQSFYNAAVQYTSLTGYLPAMSDADFIRIIYKNVLGRSGENAPTDADVQYWAMQLATDKTTKGGLIRTMLASAHSFENDATWGWVPRLLDNKVSTATYFAVQQGLSYNTAEDSISKTMAIAAAVTAIDTSTAVGLIDADDPSFSLTSGNGVGVITVSVPGDGRLQWNVSTNLAITLKTLQGVEVPKVGISCAAADPAQLTAAADCSSFVGRRLGLQQVTVSGAGITANFTVKVIPQRQPIGSRSSNSSGSYNFVASPAGNVLAWGGDADGRLGQGKGVSQLASTSLPVFVKDAAGSGKLSNIVAASTGNQTAMALTEDGEVFAWGEADQLGRNDVINGTTLPLNVRNAANNGNLMHIVQVSAGDSNMTALADDGTVYTWGYYHGQGTSDRRKFPDQVRDPSGNDVLRNVVTISSGWNYALALTADGKVYGWGWNSSGQTGRGTVGSIEYLPAAVKLAFDDSELTGIVAISAGYNFAFALSADGRVYAWGNNSHGQLGQNVQYGTWSRAVLVKDSSGSGTLSNIAMISAGGHHALAMDNSGKMWSWGLATSGQLGDGPNRPTGNQWLRPRPVVSESGTGQLSGAISIGAGYNHSMVLRSDGSIMIWGDGYSGNLGQGGTSSVDLTVPTVVKETADSNLVLSPLAVYQNLLGRGR